MKCSNQTFIALWLNKLAFFHPAVTISLEQSVYSVAEADGVVEVCAVLQGQLTRFVSVQLSSMDGTAGESLL